LDVLYKSNNFVRESFMKNFKMLGVVGD
jgi:hypothetical protein